ncbi:Vacuolar protein sorting-associated protein [Aspergillus sp. HF37]|nr:Vacuolar protein sorting-associated protein [Aspergillus sp. HF37]
MLTDRPSDARRYFKQSEIVLYRQAPEIAATPQIAQQQQIQQQQLLQQQQQQQPLPPGSATAGPGQQQNHTVAATAA